VDIVIHPLIADLGGTKKGPYLYSWVQVT